jgi:hypothetical protein
VRGAFDNDPAILRQSIIDGHRAGWQVAAHAIGDAAVDLVLDALDEAERGGPFPARGDTVPRHRIEHGVRIRNDQIGRLARAGMTVVTQPCFIEDFGDPLLQRHERRSGVGDYFRMRSLMAAGVSVVGSSDRPVAEGPPLKAIQQMVERSTAAGQVFGADECLSPAEALACYTVAGARAAHAEGRFGWLAPSLAADLVVLDDDPTTVDVTRIGAIGVLATVVGGQAAHDPGSLFGDAGPD